MKYFNILLNIYSNIFRYSWLNIQNGCDVTSHHVRNIIPILFYFFIPIFHFLFKTIKIFVHIIVHKQYISFLSHSTLLDFSLVHPTTKHWPHLALQPSSSRIHNSPTIYHYYWYVHGINIKQIINFTYHNSMSITKFIILKLWYEYK